MKTKNKFYLMVIIIGICILAFIFVLAQLVKINSECVGNPFIYAANSIIDQKGEIINSVCFCDINGLEGFYFDRNGIYKDNPILSPLESPKTDG